MYPAMKPKRLTGNELLISPNGEAIGSLLDFWRWAYSDLVGNAERGALAEYIVACALDIADQVRISWDKYDLLTKEGISVEVKTSGYLQTWQQQSLSKPIFGIQPTYGWDSKSNEYSTEQKRQADIYVFCLHKHIETESVNPLSISQWEFYLLPTHMINVKFKSQKTASLSSLLKAGAQKCDYHNLNAMILHLCTKNNE